jgi:molybdate transport system substrate-binding protein
MFSRSRLVIALAAFAVSLARADDLQVFAAASLADAVKEIATGYEKEYGDRLLFNFAGSNVLARQIREGAPADVFLSADDAQMNALQKSGLIVEKSRREILSNTLVIVAGRASPLKLDAPQGLAQAGIERLALADPKAVPAGVYAREYLKKLGVWEQLEARVIPMENVRAALAAVEAGNVDAGIVYKTDAAISKSVKVIYEVPAADGPAISYPAAIVTDSQHAAAAEKFVAHLESAQAREIFEKFGFLVAK